MADPKRQILSPEEVQQAINSMPAATPQPGTPGAMTNPNGFQPVSQVDTSGVPQSAAWRNVQQTGNAATDYKGLLGAQPGAYMGRYQQPLNQTMNNLLGQKPFNYDVNTDALYQQIKDNYIKQGRQAMMNTQGAAAALTGGYGNSYGALAGQQAYQESLGNLSAQIPELYQLAYQRYLGNENSQRQNLAALQGLDESEYQRYQYDTQQYEQKLADAYAKAHRGGGGGGKKKKDPREDAEFIIDYAAQNGWNYEQTLAALASANDWSEDYTKSVYDIANEYIDYHKAEESRERARETVDRIVSYFTNPGNDTKKPGNNGG
jgi:hypothetical protein